MINKRLLQYKSTSGQASDDPALRANEQRKLNEMIRYCETDECLRQFILSYFGDNSPCTCENAATVWLWKMRRKKLISRPEKRRKRHCSLLI